MGSNNAQPATPATGAESAGKALAPAEVVILSVFVNAEKAKAAGWYKMAEYFNGLTLAEVEAAAKRLRAAAQESANLAKVGKATLSVYVSEMLRALKSGANVPATRAEYLAGVKDGLYPRTSNRGAKRRTDKVPAGDPAEESNAPAVTGVDGDGNAIVTTRQADPVAETLELLREPIRQALAEGANLVTLRRLLRTACAEAALLGDDPEEIVEDAEGERLAA